MDRLTLTLTAAAILGIAWALARQAQGQGGYYEPNTDAADWDTPPAEADQTNTLWDDAIVTLSPSTYTPAAVTDEQAQANVAAFLSLIAYAERTTGPNGYRILFGGGTFNSYADHPRIYVPFRNTSSSAAGRYQILARTWDTLANRLNLPDFSPASQDAAAIELIREKGALNDVRAGRVDVAVSKVRKVWASLPGAGYDQPERNINTLVAAFVRAGGQLEQTA